MDAIVIIVSFALDISIAETDLSGELGKTILIVFLMWRMIRILNGNYTSTTASESRDSVAINCKA